MEKETVPSKKPAKSPSQQTQRKNAAKAASTKSRTMPGNSLSMTPEMLRRQAQVRLGK